MATTTIDKKYQKNEDKDRKSMLERMKEIAAEHADLYEALRKDDRSLIRD